MALTPPSPSTNLSRARSRPAPVFLAAHFPPAVLSALNRHEEALPHFAYLASSLPSGEMRRSALMQGAEVKRILGQAVEAAEEETKA